MSSWSQKRLEGVSFPAPVGVPRRAPLYEGVGGRNGPHGPCSVGCHLHPSHWGCGFAGCLPSPLPIPLHPPMLESCLWAGDWFWLLREGQGWSWSLGKPEGWKVGGPGGARLGEHQPWSASPNPWRDLGSKRWRGSALGPGRPARMATGQVSHMWLWEGEGHLAVGEKSPGDEIHTGPRGLASLWVQ